MRPEEIKQEISRLELSEKILLIEDVWDAIAISNQELPMAKWQKQEIDQRYKSYKAGEQNLHDWQSVHNDIRNKYK